MKKKIIKLWGVGMIVVLMASLLIVGATPASAGTLAWTATGMPGGFGTNQIAATDASIVKIAPNGDIFVVDTQPAAPADSRIYKSVNGGKTWVTGYVAPVGAVPAVEQFTGTGTVIADLVISPSYETDSTVFVLGNAAGVNQVYRSVNGGLNFAAFGVAVGGAGEVGMCIDLDPNYNNAVGGSVMVGTQTGLAGGGVYVWTTGGFAWINQGLAEDVYAAVFSPSFALDATIVVVGSTALGARLHHEVGLAPFGAWDPISVGTPPLDLPIVVISAGAVPAVMVTADIAIPDGYNASIPTSRTCYVAINTGAVGGQDTVYRVISSGAVGAAAALNPAVVPVIPPAVPNVAVRNIDFSGTNAAGTLAVGIAGAGVFVSSNPGTAATFATAIIGPTPAAPLNSYVAMTNTYAADSTIYVGTSGGVAGDESAVSISYDSGANWAQIGLIDTTSIAAGAAIQDFVPQSSTEWYMVTGVAAAGLPLESLWKTVDGGLSWVRIATLPTVTGTAAVTLSENFAADSTMYFMETGATAAVAPLLRYSGDGGGSWEGRATPAALVAGGSGIGDMLAVDQFTLYIGDVGTGTVHRSINAGWLWNPQILPLAAGGVNQLAYDAGTGHILAGIAGGQSYLNSTGLAFAAVGTIVGGGATVVAFDAGYATNNIIYAGDSTGVVAGIWRFTVGGAPPLAAINGVLIPTGIVCAPDGTLYAADATAAAAGAGGILRILAPAAPGPPPVAEYVSTGDGLVANNTLQSLTYAAGSNILFAMDNSAVAPVVGNRMVTYTDTLTQAVPTVVSPAEGDIVLAGAATVVIEPVAGIPAPGGTYQVQWSSRADYLGAVGDIGPIVAITNAANLNALLTPVAVPAGATIYFRVQLLTPLLGPWSESMSIETQLAGAQAPNSPVIVVPQPAANGGTNVGLNPTFFWGGVIGATSYEFQLATDAGMTDIIVDASGPDALGNVLSYELVDITLEYNTTYYWAVAATSATSETFWSLPQGFTTMAEAVEPPPPVTVTDVPQPTFTVEIPPAPPATTITQPPQVVEKISEGYIWAIIIIGAVLVIAVIVLVVRTRRSV